MWHLASSLNKRDYDADYGEQTRNRLSGYQKKTILFWEHLVACAICRKLSL